MSLTKIVIALSISLGLNGCGIEIETPWTPPKLEDPFNFEKAPYIIDQNNGYLSTPPLTISTESTKYTTSINYEKSGGGEI